MRSEISQEIEQLTQIIQFIHELKVETDQENLENKLEHLKLEMNLKLEKDKQVRELQAIHNQLLRQREDDRIKKEKLLQQIAKMKNQAYEYSIYDNLTTEDLTEEKEIEKSAYGFSMPPIYIRLDSSVVNCLIETKLSQTQYFNDDTDDFYSCSESEISNIED